ncbi:MAG: pro-sigmaK processing inhibitor BofA family protein [Clostridia bacterium]|nr:pro-sigmaK processing inhibitor BofA family protein [Clostridia bacterium]
MEVVLTVTLAVVLTAVLIGALLTRRPLQALGGSALSGVGALMAVNVVGIFSGVTLAVNAFSMTVCALLGIPGVILLAVLQTMCFVPMI